MKDFNACIESTEITRGRGVPTLFLNLTFDGSGQGFGGYDLRRYGVKMIFDIMDVVGVNSWEELTGKYVRVRSEDGLLTAIGHIVEDRWYRPRDHI